MLGKMVQLAKYKIKKICGSDLYYVFNHTQELWQETEGTTALKERKPFADKFSKELNSSLTQL